MPFTAPGLELPDKQLCEDYRCIQSYNMCMNVDFSTKYIYNHLCYKVLSFSGTCTATDVMMLCQVECKLNHCISTYKNKYTQKKREK